MPRLEAGNIPGYKKKVMLISATPMNNSPADIYNEILLFQDPRRCTIDGVSNLTAFFSPLIKEFKRLRKNNNTSIEDFKRLAEKVRDRIIKPLTVRRTRTDIESIPRYNKDVNGFPKVEHPIKNQYELNEHLANLFEQAIQILDKKLTYARYQAIAYLKPEVANGLYDNAELISRSLAGIRKNGLVKRLESSFYAFQVSIENFHQANQNLIMTRSILHQTLTSICYWSLDYPKKKSKRNLTLKLLTILRTQSFMLQISVQSLLICYIMIKLFLNKC